MQRLKNSECQLVFRTNLFIKLETLSTVSYVRAKNLVVNNGLNLVRDLLGGNALPPSHIGVGTGTTPVVASDSAIETEVFRSLITRRIPSPQSIRFQLFLGSGEANGNTLTEAGIIETGVQNGSAGDPGLLVARVVYSPINKTSGLEVTYNWDLDLTAT